MSLTTHIWSLIFGSFLALGAWVFVLFNIDPYEAGVMGQIFFYFSLGLFLMGIFVNILVWLRLKFLGADQAIETMSLSFRQGFLLALLLIVLLVLRANEYLIWWVGLLVVAGVFLIELIFLSKEE